MTQPSSFSPGARATALALIGQYGDDAAVMAVMRAAELAALGDLAGLESWDEIIACIAAIELGVDGGAPKH